MIRKLLLSATAFTALSGAALAADLPARVAAPMYAPPVFTWTGFYVGGTVGAVAHLGTTSNPTNTEYEYFYAGDSIQTHGVGAIGGLEAGYNMQMGALVFGIEADYSLASSKGTSNAYGGFGDYGVGIKSGITSLGTVRGRLGFAVDRALFFVTGGWAYGHAKDTIYDDGWYIYDGGHNQSGWTVGGGVEYALSPNWTVKAEGLYYDLGKKTIYNDGEYSYDVKHEGVVARIGVNYKF